MRQEKVLLLCQTGIWQTNLRPITPTISAQNGEPEQADAAPATDMQPGGRVKDFFTCVALARQLSSLESTSGRCKKTSSQWLWLHTANASMKLAFGAHQLTTTNHKDYSNMFISSTAYTNTVLETIADSTTLSIAVAFWGAGSEALFKSISDKKVRVICNLTSGGTNPKPIDALRVLAKNNPKVEVKQLDNLHAKVIIGEQRAIIGSANFSTNGLCLEGQECAGWQEAGFQTTDPTEVAAAQNWFDATWGIASEIDDDDMNRALENWETRSKAPVFSVKNKRNLMQQPDSLLTDLDVYVVVFRNTPTAAASEAHGTVLTSLSTIEGGNPHLMAEAQRGERSFYQNWGEALQIKVPLIDVYCDESGHFKVNDIWERDGIDGPFSEDGVENTFEGVKREKMCGKYAYGPTDRKKLKERLQPFMEALLKDVKTGKKNIHICVRLSEALGLTSNSIKS